jgi:hypothetical protein
MRKIKNLERASVSKETDRALGRVPINAVYPAHVWYLGKSGKHMLAASSSHFDPNPTSLGRVHSADDAFVRSAKSPNPPPASMFALGARLIASLLEALR